MAEFFASVASNVPSSFTVTVAEQSPVAYTLQYSPAGSDVWNVCLESSALLLSAR